MNSHKITFKDDQMKLLICEYLAEHNQYKALYIFKQEAKLSTPIFNNEIDLVNELFVEEQYSDVQKFLITLPRSSEMFELLFKVTQLELFNAPDEIEQEEIENELQQYFSIVSADEVQKYSCRLRNINAEILDQLKSEVFLEIQAVLIPYYNEMIGSECIFTQLPGKRLETLVEECYQYEISELPEEEQPKTKSVEVDLFANMDSGRSSSNVKCNEQASEVTNTIVPSTPQELVASLEEEENQHTMGLSNNEDMPKQQASEHKEAAKEQVFETENHSEEINNIMEQAATKPLSIIEAEEQLTKSEYFVVECISYPTSFCVDLIQYIKQEGIYRIEFSPEGAKTTKYYNTSNSFYDEILMFNNKQFFMAIDYLNLEISIFDIDFHDSISIKDFSDIIQDVILDCCICNDVLFVLTEKDITAFDILDFGMVGRYELQLYNNEKVKYFYLGQIPVICTSLRALFVNLRDNELTISQEYKCKYDDCAVIGQNAMLSNINEKMYIIDFNKGNKALVCESPARILQFTEECVYGITTANELFCYYLRTKEMKVNVEESLPEEVVYFQVFSNAIFWLTKTGLFGINEE